MAVRMMVGAAEGGDDEARLEAQAHAHDVVVAELFRQRAVAGVDKVSTIRYRCAFGQRSCGWHD